MLKLIMHSTGKLIFISTFEFKSFNCLKPNPISLHPNQYAMSIFDDTKLIDLYVTPPHAYTQHTHKHVSNSAVINTTRSTLYEYITFHRTHLQWSFREMLHRNSIKISALSLYWLYVYHSRNFNMQCNLNFLRIQYWK